MSATLTKRLSLPRQAILSAALGALVGTVLLVGPLGPGPARPAFDVGRADMLEGVLEVAAGAEHAGGTHWTASLAIGGNQVPVRLSHADSHQTDLHGALVQATGEWAADGSFVVTQLGPADPFDPATEASLAAATPATPVVSGRGRTLEGTLSFAHGDDFAGGRKTGSTFHLTDRHGGITEVTFKRPPSSGLLGRHVRLVGVMDGDRLLAADGDSVETVTTSSATSYSTGSHRVAVVLFNFSNDTSQPYTPEYARGVAFSNTNSVAAYYAVNSWGQLTLTGEVFGWVTISNTNANCAYSTWTTAANSAATSLGFDPSDYDNIVYAFPQTSCGWAGLASMPGKTSWLNGSMAMSLRVMAHELGHNFGTHHAGDYKCSEDGVRVALSASAADCTTGEYGDPFSVMGGSTRHEHTNFARGNLDWLAPANTRVVTEPGDYLLAPIEFQSSTAITSLRVARTSSSYFTVEFRQPDGTPFDNFAATAPVVNGVLLRLTASSYGTRTQTWLIWAHPSSTYCDCYAPLQAGESLADPMSGVTFTVKEVSTSGALVGITFGGSPQPSPTPAAEATAGTSPAPSPIVTPSPSPTPRPTVTPSPTPSPHLTAPGNLKATVGRKGKVSLSWTASSGDVKVAGYRIYRDGALVATSSKTRWADTVLLAAGSSRTYYVVAFDAAGTVSPPSSQVAVP